MNAIILDNSNSNFCNYYDQLNFNNEFLGINELLIFNLNIRSFNSNFDELSQYLNGLKLQPAVLVLTETWFSECTITEIDGYVSYHTYRKDSRGGGVSIYVRNSFSTKCITNFMIESPDVEMCAVTVNFSSELRYDVLGFYRPPSGNLSLFNSYILSNILTEYTSSTPVILCGDFNIDLINPTGQENDFINHMNSFSFLPHINKPTSVCEYSSTCIDHIWTNQLCEIKSGIFEIKITDHYPVFLLIKFPDKKNLIEITFRDHSEKCLNNLKYNVNAMISLFEDINFDDVNAACNLFNATFYNIYNTSCPIRKKKISFNSFSKPWIKNDLKIELNRKHAFYKDYKRGYLSFNSYKMYSNCVGRKLKKAKIQYYTSKFSSIQCDQKGTWKEINKLLLKKPKKNKNVELHDLLGNIVSPDSVADSFNDYFSKVGVNLNANIPPSSVTPLHYMNEVNTIAMETEMATSHEVHKIISSLLSKKSDIKDVPIFIYKFLNDEISNIICKLFNGSIQSGIFPDCNKLAKIVPIHKSGDSTTSSNFRPISLLPILSKIFEKLMHYRLNNFVERNNLIRNNQFGFRKSRSTTDVVLEFLDHAFNSLNEKNYLIAIYLDLSKAFDTINHEILLTKLNHMGIRGGVGEWFKSYLSSRHQYVTVNGFQSSKNTITTGVPQGSVLGPLLFTLYINDMANACGDLESLHFADDTTLFLRGNNISSDVLKVNSGLDVLDEWLKANKLVLNLEKTTHMIIGNHLVSNTTPICMRGFPIAKTSHTKFLGIILDEKLNFKLHVEHVCNRLARAIGVVRRVSQFVTVAVLKKLYYSLFFSHMIYGVVAWGNSSILCKTKMNILQNRFLRLFPDGYDYKKTAKEHNILKFDSILFYFSAIKFYECFILNKHEHFRAIFNNYVPSHSYRTRFSTEDNLLLPLCNTTSFQKSFLYNSIEKWNSLNVELKHSESIEIFKNRLKSHLLQ